MEIIIKIANIAILAIFILCVSNVLRIVYAFVSNLMAPAPEKFEITKKERLYLGISISLIIALLIKGLTL